jgi:hypothetical protein
MTTENKTTFSQWLDVLASLTNFLVHLVIMGATIAAIVWLFVVYLDQLQYLNSQPHIQPTIQNINHRIEQCAQFEQCEIITADIEYTYNGKTYTATVTPYNEIVHQGSLFGLRFGIDAPNQGWCIENFGMMIIIDSTMPETILDADILCGQ